MLCCAHALQSKPGHSLIPTADVRSSQARDVQHVCMRTIAASRGRLLATLVRNAVPSPGAEHSQASAPKSPAASDPGAVGAADLSPVPISVVNKVSHADPVHSCARLPSASEAQSKVSRPAYSTHLWAAATRATRCPSVCRPSQVARSQLGLASRWALFCCVADARCRLTAVGQFWWDVLQALQALCSPATLCEDTH